MNNNQALIQALNNCAAECNNCATACLDEDNIKMMTACIKLDMDCATICTATATLLSRNSKHGKHLLKECIEICIACAEACEKHADMYQHCKVCAAACRASAKACKEMM
jgi:hypothetical protein